MNALKRRSQSERGDTLLELIVAIAILGVCVVAIGSGIVLSVKMSAIHRAQATAQQFLHNYAEALQSPSAYIPCNGCTSPPDYVSPLPPPDGFETPIEAVSYWGGTSFSTSYPSTDPGLQQVALTLTSKDGLVSESLVVVLRSVT